MKPFKLRGISCFFLLLVVTLFTGVHAAPYGPQGMPIEWQQPTGEKVDLRVFGDEHYACTETLDGYTVVCDRPTKTYYYAALSADGNSFVATAMAAGTGDPQTLGLAPHLRIAPAAAASIAKERHDRWELGMQTAARWQALKAQRSATEQAIAANGPQFAPPSTTTTGTKVGLTLLIDFDDDQQTVPQANIDDFCNGSNYTGYGNNGSVKQYYLDNSNNLLNYTNVVTAYVRIPNSKHPKSYYNDINKDCGAQANLLIKDAIDILKASSQYPGLVSSLNSLTVDSGNNAVAFNVFYAGGNGGTWTYGLWPHAWSLYNVGPQTLTGALKVNKYQITNIGNSLELGTFCHENGHMLCGYPDLYDYQYDSKGGAGDFCLMDYGGHGHNPSLICAYLKYASGWSTLTDVTSATSLNTTLTATPGAPGYNHFCRFQKPGVPTEYFLFENRQQSGRDAGLPASGIAVWHVDELGERDNQSLIPNSSHLNYELTLVQADNKWDFENNTNSGDALDLYFSGNNASLTDITSPNAHWWNGSYSGLNANSIGTSGATMNLLFGVGLDPDTIRVDSPNGGETLYHGQIRTILWSSTISGHVKIELYKGGVFSSVLSADETNDGSYTWDVSPDLLPASNYRVKISSLTNPLPAEDSSNANFSIVAAPPTITSPLIAIGVKNQSFSYQITATNRPTIYGASSLPTGLNINTASGLIAGTPTIAGTYDVTLSATNAIGIGSATLRLYIDATTITLATALNNPSLTWTTGGTSGWFVETSATHDGASAAQSRPLGNSQENWIETTVMGTGVLSFWWAVSSETYDKLHFTIDGVENLGVGGVTPISGNIPWRQQTTVISEGLHTLRWSYVKDVNASQLSDTAWLDQVTYTSVLRLPAISVEQPEKTLLTSGSTTPVNFGTVISGSNKSLTFTVRNLGDSDLNLTGITIDGTNRSDYSVTVQPVSPVAKIDQTKTPPTISSTTFTVQLTPSAVGVRTATLHLPSNDTGKTPFDIKLTGTVAPSQEYPGGTISIPKTGDLTTPSTVTVSGITGNVLSVKLKINGFNHTFPSDVRMYLSAPSGNVCGFMAGAGGNSATPYPSPNLVFDDTATLDIPASASLVSRSYRPKNYANSLYYSRPVGIATGTVVTTMNGLGTGTINGTWSLYTNHFSSDLGGSIASWALVIETSKPALVVEYPSGTSLVNGNASVDFGNVDISTDSGDLTCTVKNTGTDTLSGLAVTKDGSNAANFTVGSLASTSLAPNTSTTFTMKYTPSLIGTQTAAIHLASNDPYNNPFNINLSGTATGSALQAWRFANFGSYANSGDAADLADPDNDGLANLLEFAFGLNPTQPSFGKLPVPQAVDNNLVLSFTEPTGISGITYGAEWSQTLQPDSWSPIQNSAAPPDHFFSVPMADKAPLFMRLKVETP